jgi:hypothetical protein
MILYLAGGITGNLKPMWKIAAQRVSQTGYERAVRDSCKSFLQAENAGTGSSASGREYRPPKTEPG